MFFTQEDYRKIEKWLLANSRKDTELAGAATPLKGNETVVLVQNGKNVNVLLKDLIEQIFLLGVSDFLNVTDKYNESYISLTQAIQLIPFKSRKTGQVITFLDENGKWRIYQFQGARLNQWNNTTLWIDLIKQIQGISIIDSEDIIVDINNDNQASLYLADKNYNTADYSGLGRVYLRKNIQRVQNPDTGVPYNTNLLTQQMISKENTIYIIQYDYDLNKQTITIPSGCVLQFEGGSVSNGIVKGINTKVTGNLTYSIFNDCLIEGFNLEYLDLRWFGAVENEDCSEAFRRCIDVYNLAITTPIKVIGRYKLNSQIDCVQGLMIWNDTNSGYAPNPIHIPTGGKLKYVGEIDVAKNITAFKVYHAGIPPLQYAKEATVSFRGIKFTCSEAINSNDYTSVLLEYRAGGRPSRAFKFEDSIISGFDKAFYFTGGDSKAGSMASGILFDNVNFKYNNYAIYTKSENPNITDMSFTGLQIVRCSFEEKSKLHLQGLYGSNSITLSIFQNLDSPIYATLRVGHLKIDKVYLENITGDYIFEGVQSGRDFVSILELGELYNINLSYSKPKFNIKMKNLTLTHYPSHLQNATLQLDNCTLDEQVIYGSNYGPIDINNIVMNEGTVNSGNKVGSVCVKTGIYKTTEVYSYTKFNHTFALIGLFDVDPIDTFLDFKEYIPLKKLTNTPDSVQFPFSSPSSLGMSASRDYVFVFYKGNGYLSLQLYNSENILIETIPLPYTEGINIVKVNLIDKYNGGYAKFKYNTAMTTERYISPIGVFAGANKPLQDFMVLVSSKRSYRTIGNTNQRPNVIESYKGFNYYDITLDNPIIWDGTDWINSDGTLVDKVVIV